MFLVRNFNLHLSYQNTLSTATDEWNSENGLVNNFLNGKGSGFFPSHRIMSMFDWIYGKKLDSNNRNVKLYVILNPMSVVADTACGKRDSKYPLPVPALVLTTFASRKSLVRVWNQKQPIKKN